MSGGVRGRKFLNQRNFLLLDYFLDCVSSDLPPGGLLPLHHEAAVEPVNSNQLVMGALLNDLTVIDNKNLVGMAHGFQPVDNHNDRLIAGQFRNSLHQLLFIFGVNIGSGFVQNDDGCVLHDGARNGNSLTFAAGERRTAFADDGVKAVRQCHDKVVAPRLLCSGLHLLHGGIGLSEADVIGDGVREQIGPLEHEGEIADEAVVALFPHIPPAKAHAAALHVPEPRHEIAESGLAGAGGADDSSP